MDYDIVTVKSSPNRYFWGERAFELPELKMLLDAVSSARFISEGKSRQLIRKITSLASTQQMPELKRHITAIGKSKSDNKSLYYIIDTITNAMELRGFGKNKKRTWYAKKELTVADYICMILAIAVFVGVILFSQLHNHGRFWNPFVYGA